MATNPKIPDGHYDPIALGEALQDARIAHGWSLREASRRAGLSHSHLLRLERGDTATGGEVSLATLWHLANAYGVSPLVFFEAGLPQLGAVDQVAARAEADPSWGIRLARLVAGRPALRRMVEAVLSEE